MPQDRPTIAIMQPYFYPYAGYYRLIAESDLFVIYDCVQFPRRGWLHRNKLRDRAGAEQWLTLPLVKQSQDVLIRDLRFPENARAELAARLLPFPLPTRDPDFKAELMARTLDTGTVVVDYLEATLGFVARHLGLRWNVRRSSSFDVPASFRGQDRIIEIARRAGATRYINAPGGGDLYDAASFDRHGLELAILSEWKGAGGSMLGRVLAEDPATLAAELHRSTFRQLALDEGNDRRGARR